MCGIAGMMSLDGVTPDDAALDALVDALRHRGPDGEGRFAAGGVGLIQTRLAIIDLNTGDQPLYAEQSGGEQCVLVGNGEIYNYVELREELGTGLFKTQSDCEPPLQLYLKHGPDYPRYLRGMYALAVYDAARRQLIVSRDPLGIKPLYYTETSSGFCFASEPQALIKAGLVQPNVCEKSIHELLQLQFSCGPQTAFENIHRVLPGETLVVENGRIVGRHKINALPEERPRDQSLDEALHRLDEVFAESVELHQRADVPYGMFLSGGVDSSAVLAMMKRLNAEPVHAFTAGFADSTVHDERAQARRIAKVVGAKHTEVEFTESDFWTLLPRAAAAMDDPAADYAVLPSYKLAQAAKEAGLKVILTGEGGDELFAGYGRYRRARRLKLFGGRPMRHRGILEGLGVLRQETDSFHWRDGIAAVEHDAGTAGLTALQAAQATDCADWLPHDLLTKLDRCLMAFGVEGRVPFLDQRMAEFAFTLPDHLKVRRGMGKWLLRTWLDRHLPEAAPFARKRGFTVPVGAWIATRAAEIGPLVAKQPGVEELCDPKAVVNLFNSVASNQNGQSAKAAWTLVFYALWHQTHILNKAPAKSVQESLA